MQHPIPFNPEKHYLGRLCPHGHDRGGGQSAWYKSAPYKCLDCAHRHEAARQQKRRTETKELDFPGEVWLPLKQTVNYVISNFGRIRHRSKRKPLRLSVHKDRNGYTTVNLNRNTLPVSVLVVKTFMREIKADEYITHLDGDRSNNQIDNLKIVSRFSLMTDVISSEEEMWRPIEVAPGYEVSNLGRVRSASPPSLLGGSRTEKGYITVRLVINRKQKAFRVHRLVAATFIGSVGEDDIVDHLDRDRANNRADNLRIVDHKGNAANRDSTVSVGLVRRILELSWQGLGEEEIVRRLRTVA